MQFLWKIYIHFLFLFVKIYNFFMVNPDVREKTKTILAKSIIYMDNNKSQFLKFQKTASNDNIDAAFYSKPEFKETTMDGSNELEKRWKTRILFETTPRGNIIMYYDAFKLGFSYFSDSNSIPYNVLNSVAMKYVSVFKCYDLFFDNEVTGKESPIYKTLLEEEPKKNNTKDNTVMESDSKKKEKTGFENAPFAKLKNYSKISAKTNDNKKNKNPPEKNSGETDKPPENKKECIRNKFICLGKMSNFEFIQKPKKIFKENGFKTTLLDGVTSESALQKKVMNYQDYKKLLQESPSPFGTAVIGERDFANA
jgi:hypothetical protein